MDNFETDSNCSFQSDSLQSNASSSFSGLSTYGNEFAELRHIINPAKYPQPYLDRNTTPKPEQNDRQNDNAIELQEQLRKSQELNRKYELDLQNLERKIELKHYEKIDQLLRTNGRLEGELESANNQIERLIENYKEKQGHVSFKEKLDLEKSVYKLNTDYGSLQKQYVKIQKDKLDLEAEYQKVKIALEESRTEIRIKRSSIESLKDKISEQQIEIRNWASAHGSLKEQLNHLTAKHDSLEQSRTWYRDQLTQSQDEKLKLKEDIDRYRTQLADLNEKNSCLHIDLLKFKNEVDEVRLQALKEKAELLRRLETISINVDVLKHVPENNNINNSSQSYNLNFYEQTIDDLKEEVSRIKIAIIEKDKQYNTLAQENSAAISKCLILQKSLEEKEATIYALETSKKELTSNVQICKENEKRCWEENFQLKNKIGKLEIDLKMRYDEKQIVDEAISSIQQQFLTFKGSYEKVKQDLHLKNKAILQMEKEKQELFMNNNWTICELEKIKQKESILMDLQKENKILQSHVEAQNNDLKGAKSSIETSAQIIRDKDKHISDLANENVDLKKTISQFEVEIDRMQNELMMAFDKLHAAEKDINDASEDIRKKASEATKLRVSKEKDEQSNKEKISNLINERDNILSSYERLETKYNQDLEIKDKQIFSLKIKLEKMQSDWQTYVKRITDDQKAELLLSHNCFLRNDSRNGLSLNNIENYVLTFFDNFNIDEFESTVDVRLRYMEERVRKIKNKAERLEEKVKNDSKVKELEVLLQVKDKEIQEKRKKMDRNNRTLLKKVKEHMRGRNSAEKQLNYLQDMYNALANTKNTLQLSLSTKQHEIESLKEFCDLYKKEAKSLKDTVVNLEQNLPKKLNCSKCLDLENATENLRHLKSLCEDVQERNRELLEKLKCTEQEMERINQMFQQQEVQLKNKEMYIAKLTEENEELKKSLTIDQNHVQLIEELQTKLLEKDKIQQNSTIAVEKLQQNLQYANEKIQFLAKELQTSSINFNQKIEYNQELESKLRKYEENLVHTDLKHSNIVNDYKMQISLLHDDLKILRNDKLFLQRLSNDLKFALRSYIEHNKILQEKLKLKSPEAKGNMNVITSNFIIHSPGYGKYDEKYIKQLLEENKLPSNAEPVTEEVQRCLAKLREEIFSLQHQVRKKNGLAGLAVEQL